MRSVIVTGGSRGIGLGITKQLLTSGYQVVVIARKSNLNFDACLQDAERSSPGCLHFLPFDLEDTSGIPALGKTLRKVCGTIYGLVNNAGISVDGALPMLQTSQIEKVVRVNTIAPIMLARSVLGSMMAAGEGRIVNVASVTALTGYAGLSVYSATKSSLIGFTRSLAREAGPHGITVNAVAPGFIETELTAGASEEMRQKIARRNALKRPAAIEDVARAVCFLLDDDAKCITGTTITVDAGNTA
jgi:3-oxoacyl-[acyl-carrier protein] reductase